MYWRVQARTSGDPVEPDLLEGEALIVLIVKGGKIAAKTYSEDGRGIEPAVAYKAAQRLLKGIAEQEPDPGNLNAMEIITATRGALAVLNDPFTRPAPQKPAEKRAG